MNKKIFTLDKFPHEDGGHVRDWGEKSDGFKL